MSVATIYQNSFTVGEIDPLLQARVDLQQYEAGLDRAKNVVIMPQGGFERRPGLRFMQDLSTHKGNGLTDKESFRLVPFEFSTTQSYMLVFVKNSTNATNNVRMFVYANLQLQTNINGTGNDYLECSFGDLDLSKIFTTQSADTLIVVQEDMPPKQIVRGLTNSSWAISDATISPPFHAFSKNTYNPAGTATPSAVDGTIDITFSSSAVLNAEVTGTAGTTTANTIVLTGASTTANFLTGAKLEITGGTGAGQIRFITNYTSSRVATVSSNWTTQPVSGDSTFKVHIKTQQYVIAQNGFGRARIIERESGTVAKAVVEIPFFDTGAIANGSWAIEFGYEEAFSTVRGFPRTCTFHEGRLYFGGTKNLPSTLIGSKVNDFFNFQTDEALNDDAIFVTLESDSVNAITGIRSGRDLQIFSTSSEFFIPQAELDPITPSNIVVKTATKRGSREGIRPLAAEGGTLFIQREGKAIREFLFSDVDLSYAANNISLLSSHLLKEPRHMALRLATSTDDGDLLLVTNDTDGSMMAVSILRSQNVVAASEFVTSGAFQDVAVDLTDIYTIVKRTINSQTKYYLESFDDDRTTDANIQYFSGATAPDQSLPGSTTASNLGHLEGATVKMIRDDIVLSDATVSSGNVTIDEAPTVYLEIGLDFTVDVKTLPPEPQLPSGVIVSRKKRIVEITPVLDRTQNVTVNGFNAPIQDFPITLGSALPLFTGRARASGFLGYSDTAQVSISQSDPVFFTVLGLEYKLSYGA